MTYTVRFRSRAVKQIRKLTADVLRRIVPHIDALAEEPFPPGWKKLTNQDELYRVRVGDYRIVYQHNGEELLVLVVLVGRRKEMSP